MWDRMLLPYMKKTNANQSLPLTVRQFDDLTIRRLDSLTIGLLDFLTIRLIDFLTLSIKPLNLKP